MKFRKGRNIMIIKEKYIILKDGRRALLRSPEIDDAAALIGFLAKTSTETDFLLRGADDPVMQLEDEKKFIENSRDSENSVMICCFVGENGVYRLAGNCGLNFNARVKTAHRACIGISLLREFWGLGIGTALMREMESIAIERGILQLELEFVEGNSRARALYEKCGFRIYGVHPDAFRMPDGSMRNEYLMIKKL